jgi:hypothetical protein
MAEHKGIVIKGIRFKHGEVDWEDAYTHNREKLPDIEAMRQGNEFIGVKITSAGYVAKVGKYFIVITEMDQDLEEFDYTLIPLKAKHSVRYN